MACCRPAACAVRARAGAVTDRAARLPGEFHRADLLDAREIDSLIGIVRPTHLLHFAWIATPGEYWRSAENYRWLAASTHLLDAFQAGGGVRAVMAGSCAEYDWSRAGVCNERTTPLADGLSPSGATPYAECKIALSRVARGVRSCAGPVDRLGADFLPIRAAARIRGGWFPP